MKTKWSLNELTRYKGEAMTISGLMNAEEELKKRDKQIDSVSLIDVKGSLGVDKDEYILSMQLDFSIVLPSSRSLEPTKVHMTLSVSEIFIPQGISERDEEGQDALVIELEHDWIDLKDIAVDNILAALPVRVLTDKEKADEDLPTGTGWKVLTEDQAEMKTEQDQEQGDPRFDALKTLFPNETKSKEE